MNYYSRPQVSNSDLGNLKGEMYGLQKPPNIQDIYDFGNLVDAMLTEPNLIDYHEKRIWLHDEWKIVQPEKWMLAEKMVSAMMLDPFISIVVKKMIGQYEFYKRLHLEYEGFEFSIDARAKYDGIAKQLSTGLDYKTTACTTHKAFIQSLDHFDYDRQCAWYMDIASLDRFWFVGISKKNQKVFKYAVQRGDEFYKRGKQKYLKLAYLWNIYFENFK
jgi:hypothetical protein